MVTDVKRYSDSDLVEFKTLIHKKMDRAKSELSYYLEQIEDMREAMEEDRDDWMEGANIMGDMELINDLAQRQRKYIRELEEALIRIHNKSFGICEITGEIIDKRRLLAVPTTTKSLAAKNGLEIAVSKKDAAPKPRPAAKVSSTIIVKTISKKPVVPVINKEEEEEDDLYFFDEEDSGSDGFVSLDEVADKYGYEEDYDF